MKQYWQRCAQQIDARSLRERAIMFVMAVLVLIMLVNTFMLDPQFVKQKKLSQQAAQDRAKIASIQAEIDQKLRALTVDPDSANRVRLQALVQQVTLMQGTLLDMQKGLVAPEKMSALLENIMRHDDKLRMVSLKTLPAARLDEVVATDDKAASEKVPAKASGAGVAAAKDNAATVSTVGAIYKHGVEMQFQGGYFDMIHYLAELEAMPSQLFWVRAKLQVDEYPKATLTLTLFTLSLDKKWLNI